MKNIIGKLTKGLVVVGVACLLLGATGYTQPVKGLLNIAANQHTLWIQVVSEHFSYGNWNYNTASYIAANTRDGWTSQYVPFDLPSGWSAWVLYNLSISQVDEVAFILDVEY